LVLVKGGWQKGSQFSPTTNRLWFWLKGIVVKAEFQINQVVRRSVLEVHFCLPLQNLLAKSLLCKYCKEGASVVTHFWVPAQERRKYKKKYKNTKKKFNKKNINNISKNYSGEKRMPERLENGKK